jgi:hypothetical protein
MTDVQMQQVSQILKTYRFDLKDLNLETDFIDDYIGFTPGEAPEPFPLIIREILSESEKLVRPEGGYALFRNICIDRENNKTVIGDVELGTKSIVTRHMNKSGLIAVFACTAGAEISRLASEYNKKGHTVHAYIADSLGSIVVEHTMDKIQEHLKSLMEEQGLKITNRYSPGYCGWELIEQSKLFGLLPEHFCGIGLSDSMLMKPIKSVSGIIGIGENVIYDQYTCNYCKDINCLYRGKRQ